MLECPLLWIMLNQYSFLSGVEIEKEPTTVVTIYTIYANTRCFIYLLDYQIRLRRFY